MNMKPCPSHPCSDGIVKLLLCYSDAQAAKINLRKLDQRSCSLCG